MKSAAWWQSVIDTLFLIVVVPLVVAMLVLVVAQLGGCAPDDELPTCASLGCGKLTECDGDGCSCNGVSCAPTPAPAEDAAPADANCAAVLRTCRCTADGLEECGLDVQWGCGCYPVDAGP